MSRRRVHLACAALALIALALRLALAARSHVVVDRLFLPDDTYYTLSIARSIAHGLGPTVDGRHLTSGFQPLLAYLLVPVFATTDSPDVAVRAALGIGALADAFSTYLLGALAYRMAHASFGEARGAAAGIVASALWAVSTTAIATALNGLETSLAIAAVLAALVAWSAARAGDETWRWALCGGALGLCLFARVDTAFFALAVGVVTLTRVSLRAAAATAAGAAIAIAPWWAYAIARFGSIVPESGAAVREQALVYRALGMNVRDQLAWAAGAITGPPLFDSTWLREALGSGASGIGCAIAVLIVLALLFVALRMRSAPDEMRILALYVATLVLFYSFYLPATWFFRRYLAPASVVAALGCALGIERVWSTGGSRQRAPAVAIMLVSLSASVIGYVRLATLTPSITVDQGHHGAKGYREPARQILAMAPPNAVIGSFQSGALGWFADGSGREVVNLDGVVDGEAARAVRERRLAAFAQARGITHLADWQFNARLFVERAGDAGVTLGALRKIGEAEPQGKNERFVLYAIDWPPKAL